jgi:hypothetical protein
MASKLDVTNDAGTDIAISLDGEVAIPGSITPEAQVIVGSNGHPGKIVVRDFQGLDVFRLESPFGAHLFVGSKEGLAGFVHLIGGLAAETILLNGADGRISCFDRNGNKTIELDGDRGDVKVSGAECAKMFDVSAANPVDAGTVVVLQSAEAVQPSDRAYDRRVAGIVSGAGGRHPGVILNGKNAQGVAVALAGTVFCKADATNEPIEVGDLLTTSSMIGHAMKASDASRTVGSVLGKAMAPLTSGTGLILVLVALG